MKSSVTRDAVLCEGRVFHFIGFIEENDIDSYS